MVLLLPVNWTGNGLICALKLDRKLLLPVNRTGNGLVVARKLDKKFCP